MFLSNEKCSARIENETLSYILEKMCLVLFQKDMDLEKTHCPLLNLCIA